MNESTQAPAPNVNVTVTKEEQPQQVATDLARDAIVSQGAAVAVTLIAGMAIAYIIGSKLAKYLTAEVFPDFKIFLRKQTDSLNTISSDVKNNTSIIAVGNEKQKEAINKLDEISKDIQNISGEIRELKIHLLNGK